MHLLLLCVQMVLLLFVLGHFVCICQCVPVLEASQLDTLISPIHQTHDEDLENRKLVIKSVFNTPVFTSPPSIRCPPGHQKLPNGPCVKRFVVSSLEYDQKLLATLTKQFYSNKNKSPVRRTNHHHRTSTPTPKPSSRPQDIRDLITTTTQLSTRLYPSTIVTKIVGFRNVTTIMTTTTHHPNITSTTRTPTIETVGTSASPTMKIKLNTTELEPEKQLIKSEDEDRLMYPPPLQHRILANSENNNGSTIVVVDTTILPNAISSSSTEISRNNNTMFS